MTNGRYVIREFVERCCGECGCGGCVGATSEWVFWWRRRWTVSWRLVVRMREMSFSAPSKKEKETDSACDHEHAEGGADTDADCSAGRDTGARFRGWWVRFGRKKVWWNRQDRRGCRREDSGVGGYLVTLDKADLDAVSCKPARGFRDGRCTRYDAVGDNRDADYRESVLKRCGTSQRCSGFRAGIAQGAATMTLVFEDTGSTSLAYVGQQTTAVSGADLVRAESVLEHAAVYP